MRVGSSSRALRTTSTQSLRSPRTRITTCSRAVSKLVISTAEGEACPVCHRPLLTASAAINGKAVEMKADNSSVHAVVPFTVVNTKGFELPKTGSYGTLMFTVGGVLAMALRPL